MADNLKSIIINQQERTIRVPERDISIKLADSREPIINVGGFERYSEGGCVIVSYRPTSEECKKGNFKKFEDDMAYFFKETEKLRDGSDLAVDNSVTDLRGREVALGDKNIGYEESISNIVYSRDKYEVKLIE